MASNSSRAYLIVALVAIVLLAGCSTKRQDSTETSAQSSRETTPAAEGHETDEQLQSGMSTVPAGDVAELWSQLEGEQGKLKAAIENGELKSVHHLAFGARDLVIALAGKAGAQIPANTPELQRLVEQVKESAEKLDELGDAGDLSGTQAEAARFDKLLARLKPLTATR